MQGTDGLQQIRVFDHPVLSLAVPHHLDSILRRLAVGSGGHFVGYCHGLCRVHGRQCGPVFRGRLEQVAPIHERVL